MMDLHSGQIKAEDDTLSCANQELTLAKRATFAQVCAILIVNVKLVFQKGMVS